MNTIERKFGKWKVKIEGHSILITDDWFSNYGVFYNHRFGDFRKGKKDINGYPIQIIGMDNNVPRKDILTWIQNLVLSNKIN